MSEGQVAREEVYLRTAKLELAGPRVVKDTSTGRSCSSLAGDNEPQTFLEQR